MSSSYPSDWDSRAQKVKERDDYKCQNCGRQGGPSGQAELHAHHIVPKRNGGTHKISNLVSVCEECHDAIHNDKKAPTQHSQVSPSELLDILSDLEEFLEYAQAGLAVEAPGKIQNDRLERERISLIQDLGRLSVMYEAPDDKRQRALEDMIASFIKLLRYPEDTWEKMKRDDLSREQAIQHGGELTEKRSQEVSNSINKLMSLGVASFF